MDDMIMIALGPAYILAYGFAGYVVIFLAHQARQLDASATVSQLTQTLQKPEVLK